MVNVNVQLPPVVAAPFPQATETLQRENALQTAIPKTEQTHAYAKMREQQEREQMAYQSSHIIQKDTDSPQQQNSGGFKQKRDFFFAKKLKISTSEVSNLVVEPLQKPDYQRVMSVILAKYKGAVSPIPSPSISHNV